MKKLVFGIFIFLTVCFCYAQTIPNRLLGNGELSRDSLVGFLLRNNPSLNRNTAINIVELYISESREEGVNYEIAIAQMCYYTKFLSFTTTFASEGSNNFYGCSSLNDYRVAHKFGSYREGIRAHIQHLKGYATREALENACVDPRYYRIEQEYGWGSAPTVYDLSDKKWGHGNYVNEINALLARMRQ